MSSGELRTLLDQLEHPEQLPGQEETYDLALAGALSPDERKAFVEALLRCVENDARAMLTLAEMGASEAVPSLSQIASLDSPRGRQARRALVKLGRGDAVVAKLADDAASGGPMQRFAAVMDLAHVGGPIATAALLGALDDPDDTVRIKAFEGLAALLGIASFAQNADGAPEMRSPLMRHNLLLGSSLEPLRRLGAQGLRAIASQLAAGATPEQVGIRYESETPDDFRLRLGRSMFSAAQPIPVEEIRALGGHDRQWAEAILARALERKNPRVPSVVAEIGAQWLVPVMDAAAAGLDSADAFRVEAEKAKRRLSAAADSR